MTSRSMKLAVALTLLIALLTASIARAETETQLIGNLEMTTSANISPSVNMATR